MASKPIKKKVKAVKAKAAPKSKIKKAVKKTVKAAAKKSPAKAKPAAKIVKKKKVTAPAKPIAKKADKKPIKISKQPVKKSAKPVIAKSIKPVAKEKPVVKQIAKPVVKSIQKPVSKPIVKTEKPVIIEKPVVKKEIKPVVKQKQQVQKVNGSVDNRTRYSDEELKEFRELIANKLETARSELKYLQEQISRSSEMGDDSDARFKGLEDGTSTSEREYLSQMASRQIQYIGHLEKAMIRIENKTYGICRETGRLISKERLRAVPHATLSIEAKQGGKG